MNEDKDLIGKKFGKLKVLNFAYKKATYKTNKKSGNKNIAKYLYFYECQCDCGKHKIINIQSLKRGLTVSCGCYGKEQRAKSLTKHGKTESRLYNIWCSMKQRCYNKKHKEFKYWGGKGVFICNEWKNNFQSFYDWAMKNGYDENLSIDRIDCDGNYEPSNCRWATPKEQVINALKDKMIKYKNENHTIAEWSEIVKIPYGCLYTRINTLGWDVEKALKTKSRKKQII
jgi:hypothetical protein